jgi:hypothetical protein
VIQSPSPGLSVHQRDSRSTERTGSGLPITRMVRSAVRMDQLSAGGRQEPTVVIAGLGHPTSRVRRRGKALGIGQRRAHDLRLRSHATRNIRKAPPDVVVSASPSSLLHPSGVAFDEAGNLWVANLGRHNVIAFGPDQLFRSGAPAPRRVLAPVLRPSVCPWVWPSTSAATSG